MQTGPLMTRPSAPLGALELPCIVTVLALAGEAFVKQGKKQGKKVQWGGGGGGGGVIRDKKKPVHLERT